MMINFLRKDSASQRLFSIFLILAISSWVFPISCAAVCGQEGSLVPFRTEADESTSTSTGEEQKCLENKDGYFAFINDDILDYIGKYLVDPVASLGLLNRRFHQTFHKKFPLKRYFDERFNIPELKNIHCNEKELHGLMNLLWCHEDSVLFIVSLLRNIDIHTKPSYNILINPLLAHIKNSFDSLSVQQKSELTEKLNIIDNDAFVCFIGDICEEKGQFDLAFKFLAGNTSNFIKKISYSKNKPALFTYLTENPVEILRFLNLLQNEIVYVDVATSRFAGNWIAECIIYNVPKELFYLTLLNALPSLIEYVFKPLFLSFQIPESDYPRIHLLMSQYIINFVGQSSKIDFYHLINNIRFDPELTETNDFYDLDFDKITFLTKSAFLANKKSIFLEAYHISSSYCGYEILYEIILMGGLDAKRFQMKNFSMIFEIIASEANNLFSSRQNYRVYVLKAILSAYAAKNLETEQDQITFVFEVLDELLPLGFPPNIRISIKDGNSFFVGQLLYNIFLNADVFTKDTLLSFLNDCIINSDKFIDNIYASFKLIEFISNTPSLIEKFKDSGLKLWVNTDSDDIKNYLDLPNFEAVSSIVIIPKMFRELLTKFSKIEHFRKLERLQSKTVAQCFLEVERSAINYLGEIKETDYIEFRPALSYWINGDQRERITEIRSPIIIRMLRLDFPDQMKKIFGSETA